MDRLSPTPFQPAPDELSGLGGEVARGLGPMASSPLAAGSCPRAYSLLRFIQGFQEAHGGVSPSFRDMAAGGFRSRQATSDWLDELEDDGHIRRLHFRHRAIEVLHPVSIPRGPSGEPLRWVEMGRAGVNRPAMGSRGLGLVVSANGKADRRTPFHGQGS